MRIISGTWFIIFFIFSFSCVEKSQFPEKKSEKFSASSITVKQPVFQMKSNSTDSLPEPIATSEVQQLKGFISAYENRKKDFSVEKMELLWKSVNNRIDFNDHAPVREWIEVTGFLFEITGKPVYAESLQKLPKNKNLSISGSDSYVAGEKLMPFIFTKNVDHIFVNLFVDSSVEYIHSLGGKVKITQETEDNQNVVLKFETEEKRYIEINILIPTWAKNATVTEKNVKYVATPGEYCFIARKWKTGDFVEVTL